MIPIQGSSLHNLLMTALIVIAAQTLVLHAQLTRGFVSGIVSDSSGGVIRGALVEITSQSTKQNREILTNSAGVYRFVALEPDLYQIEFSSTGFQTRKLENVGVGPAQEVILNQILTLQEEIATIEVREKQLAAGFSKATSTVERTLQGSLIRALPTTAATRDVTKLVLLAPMVTRAPGSTEFSANGQRARQNNFLIDGTDNNDLSVTVASARLIPEAVSELEVQIAPFSAEFGRNTGAQVSALTRSGGNAWHGEAWDYYRGNWLEPVSLLNKRAGFTKTPRFLQHQIGSSIGGPIHPNRSFFFGLLQLDRRREAADARNAQAAVIPTPAGFASLSTVPLGPNQTSLSRQSVLEAISFLPDIYRKVNRFDDVTTQTINGVPIEVGSIRIPLANPYNFWYGLLRFDHELTASDNLTYRYLLDKRSQPDTASNRQFGSRFTAASLFTGQNHALSLAHTFRSNLINEARFAYARESIAFPENDPKSSTVQITGAFTAGGASTYPQGRVSNIFQWQDVSTHLVGRHSIKLGVDIRRNRLLNLADADSKGTWTFATLADFLNNNASLLRQSVSTASYDARQTNQYYFFQDDLKASKALTLNLGFRYEYSGVPFGFFGAASPEIAATGVPLPARPDNNNWAPRLGIAFSPSPSGGWLRDLLGDQQTVFRGGGGIAYDLLFYNLLTATASNYPRVIRYDIRSPQTSNLFPTLAAKQNTIPAFDPTALFANAPKDIQNPTTHFLNFSIQRQFRFNYLFEIGYSGNRSYHLIRQGEINPAVLTESQAQAFMAGGTIPGVQNRRLNPAWGSRVTVESTGLAEYHALFIRIDKDLSKGLQVGGNYTWSSNFSDSDEALAIGDIVSSSPAVPQDYLNTRKEWSRSAFDRPQRLVMHYVYEIPTLLTGQGANWTSKHFLAGWQISGFSEWQSGQPFTIRTGVDSGGSGVASAWRPDFSPGGIFLMDPAEGNLRTFTTPITGGGKFLTPLTRDGLPLANSMPRGGNLGRNTLRGPGIASWNLSLGKNISVSERISVRFRADWFNLANHRNFGNPVATMNSAVFGANTTDPGGRTMLLSLKVGL